MNNRIKYYELPYNSELKQRARELRNNSTPAEKKIWNILKGKRMLRYDFTRQKIIGDFIVDIYCDKLNLIIEIDGDSHNNKQESDEIRDRYLRKNTEKPTA